MVVTTPIRHQGEEVTQDANPERFSANRSEWAACVV